ncbi:MAG: MMPL family transporter [Solirubrobacterales bacterium]
MAALAVLLVLGGLGFDVEERLKPSTLNVPGSESARGDELLRQHFGESAPFAVLLEGPPKRLDRQGSHLTRALRRDATITAVSPWDSGFNLAEFRPNGRTALVLVDSHVPLDEAIDRTVPHLQRLLAANISPPVIARTAGPATVAKALQNESVAITRRGEIIVLPLLLAVLLFVFRSPVAALVPLALGATTVIAARGVLDVLGSYVDFTGFSLSMAAMIGLALGIDYALLVVSRFREEIRSGADPAEAATVTRMTAGRTTVFAGATLFLSIVAAAFLVPGMQLVSICIAVVTVIALALVGTWVVAPAILVVLGGNIDRWLIGGRGAGTTRWLAASRAALRRPYVAALLSSLLLVLVALPAASLAVGPATVDQLPSDHPTRMTVEAIDAAIGGGWIAPLTVVVASEDGPMTEPRRLAALSRWQRRLADDPDVEAVIGPAPLNKRVGPLRRTGQSLLHGDGPDRRVARLATNLARADDGLARLRQGLGRASYGSHALAAGSGRAEGGAQLLADGLARASSGAGAAKNALRRFNAGAQRLADGERSALFGASVLRFAAGELRSDVGGYAVPRSAALVEQLREAKRRAAASQGAAAAVVENLEAAWRDAQGMGIGAQDPRYPSMVSAIEAALSAATGANPSTAARYAPHYDGLAAELAGVAAELEHSATGASRLHTRLEGVEEGLDSMGKLTQRLYEGTKRLEGGSSRLATGAEQIVDGADRLGGGLARLDDGAQLLANGLSRLTEGNSRLAEGLSRAFHRTGPLVDGAQAVTAKVTSGRRDLSRQSPGFFGSGYFVLSLLDGAPAGQRTRAGQLFALDGGGQAAKLLVVSRHPPHQQQTIALADRLRRKAAGFAAKTGTEVAVTGNVAQTSDYTRATGDRLIPLMLLITAITFLAMVVILRALPLAILAVVLNLLTVGAAFGILKLLSYSPEGLPFAASGDIAPIGVAAIFGVVFGLSIDYAVFLLMRMRESWERSGDHNLAIGDGLERTAGVITGAATVMVVVFSAFAMSPLDAVAQLGVALMAAVVLDATLIRLVLLPATMKLIGPVVWWLPAGLDKRLPRLEGG